MYGNLVCVKEANTDLKYSIGKYVFLQLFLCYYAGYRISETAQQSESDRLFPVTYSAWNT